MSVERYSLWKDFYTTNTIKLPYQADVRTKILPYREVSHTLWAPNKLWTHLLSTVSFYGGSRVLNLVIIIETLSLMLL